MLRRVGTLTSAFLVLAIGSAFAADSGPPPIKGL